MTRELKLNYDPKGKITDRVKKERAELFGAKAQIDLTKLKIQTDFMKNEAGMMDANLRQAKIFEKLCDEVPVFIDEIPILGSTTQYKYGGIFYPSCSFNWVKGQKEFGLQRGVATVNEEEAAIIEECRQWWDGKTGLDRTRDMVKKVYDIAIDELVKTGVGLAFGDDPANATFSDWGLVIHKGLKARLDDIQTYRKKLQVAGNPEAVKKLNFYDACEISVNALLRLVARYAAAAREMAAAEKNPARKAELLKLADMADRVPAYPARTFHEGIQSYWFYCVGLFMNSPFMLSRPPFRFPQYMYPLYRKDIDEGRLTDEEAIELIHFWILKLNTQSTVMSPAQATWNSVRIGMQTSLGGLDPKTGDDATNELDFLLLEAQRRFQAPEPLLVVMYHNKLSNQFLMKCVELIRTGLGQPAFHGLDVAMKRRLMHVNAPLEDLRDSAAAGCAQTVVPGKTDGTWEPRMSAMKPLLVRPEQW